MDIKVAIFEDNADLRLGMELIVNYTEGFQCVGAFPDCKNVIKNIKQTQPDVVLMDIDMPGISGIEGVRLIAANFPDVKILMQTVFDDNEKIFESIKAGALGYLLKNTSPARMLECIREVNEGGAPMSASVARKMLEIFKDDKTSKASSDFNLTAREKELLGLLVEGMNYKTIAEKLFISPFTVQTHIKHIYEKLHVNTRSEAVVKALRERLI
jgi:DNA-binding NarL/FixJ family response regulator